MALLEELGRKIAELKKKKENRDLTAADSVKRECYELLKINPDFIRIHTAEEIIAALNNDTALTEHLVDLLLEDEECRSDRKCLEKARRMLEYVEGNDRTFSFTRQRLISELHGLLA